MDRDGWTRWAGRDAHVRGAKHAGVIVSKLELTNGMLEAVKAAAVVVGCPRGISYRLPRQPRREAHEPSNSLASLPARRANSSVTTSRPPAPPAPRFGRGPDGYSHNTPQTLATNVGSSYQIIATAGFNNDHADDLLWENTTTGELTAWLNNLPYYALPTYIEQALGSASPEWDVAATGDFDGNNAAAPAFDASERPTLEERCDRRTPRMADCMSTKDCCA